MKKLYTLILSVVMLIGGDASLKAQDSTSFPTLPSLDDCIRYALQHQPALQSSLLDQSIAENQIKSNLSAWLPQVNASGTYQNNIQLQKGSIGGQIINMGVYNSSNVQFGVTQNLFTRDLLLAAKSRDVVMKNAIQTTEQQGIDVVVNVSKAYYDIMVTNKQINVLQQDTARLQKNYRDAFNQYNAGTVDKTDYQRAMISLNNSNAQIKGLLYTLDAKYVYLKQLMGYSKGPSFQIQYDSASAEREVLADTAAAVNVNDRIEYKKLQSQKMISEYQLRYAKWSYLPTVNLYGNYNLNYLNNRFGNLYNNNLPQSFLGLQASVPIFQGGKRRYNIRVAEMQLRQIGWQEQDLVNTVNTQYAQAIAKYKSDLTTANALKDNMGIAQQVYDIINLQYRSGIKAYLDVITAQTDLRSAQLNYTNSLLQVLMDKVDLNQALGDINVRAYGMPQASISQRYKNNYNTNHNINTQQ